MAQCKDLDACKKPPAFVKDTYKFYQRLSTTAIDQDAEILDLSRDLNECHRDAIAELDTIDASTIRAACRHLQGETALGANLSCQDVKTYVSQEVPGLHIVPSLIPKEAQRALLSKLLHRDLADQRHKTNVHLHHQLPYHAAQKPESLSPEREPEFPTISFFNVSPTSSEHFRPVDTALHKSLTISQFLKRKLRWVTLGGQYDWTRKCYPDENPIFPTDIAAFIHGLFPEMIPEAAIVNVYTPGDTLSVHRDVSEESEKGLVSISLGCDAIFVVGRGSKDDGDAKSLSVRLRSGDAVFMKGPARFAWHGVPQIISGSCPEWLRDWPADPHVGEVDDACNSTYEAWRGWMSNKRINLNVRQMRD